MNDEFVKLKNDLERLIEDLNEQEFFDEDKCL